MEPVKSTENKVITSAEMDQAEQYKLYSISKAARRMALGKDTLYRLIQEGKVGTILIGKRNKIPASEIIRFLNESLIRKSFDYDLAKGNLVPITEKSSSKSLFRKLKQEILNGERL